MLRGIVVWNSYNYYRNLFEEKVKGVIEEDMFQLMSKDYFSEIENINIRLKFRKLLIDLNPTYVQI